MPHSIGLLFARDSDMSLLRSYLEGKGYEVLHEKPARGELKKWRHASLIIADVDAANHYGEELPQLQWAVSTFLPLLIAISRREEADKWLERGYTDVVQMPISKSQLQTRLKLYLHLREQAEQQYKAFFENALIGIYRMKRNGDVLMANPTLCKMLGYKSLSELIQSDKKLPIGPGAHRPDFNMQLREFGKVVGFESKWVQETGATIWARENAMTIYDDDDNPLYYEGTVEDITDQKRAVEALREAKEAAEQANKAKSTFLANMSHEIRTPLTSIVGFTSFLAERLSGTELNFVHMIERSGKRLMDTLNALLTLAKLEADNVEIDYEPVAISDEVDRVTQLFKAQADDKGLDLRLTVEESAKNAKAYLDAGALNSILQNLVSNAIKFTSEGHVHIRTFVTDERREITEGLTVYPALCIQIEDTGQGIQEDFLNELFDAFKQESTGLTRTHEGIGLGLSITKQLVELMNGVIHVESEEGVGSTFSVCFPTANKPNLDDSAELPGVKKETSDISILVVEDNEETRFLLESLLGEYAQPEVTASPEDAIAAIKDRHFDLFLIDIELGTEKSGLDLLRELKANSSISNETPAIALTAYALPGDREKFLNAGFDDYLSKPFDVTELLTVIRKNI